MRRVQTTLIDPRDQTWQDDQPRYRVYFHGEASAEEHELTGATDVLAVVAWAEAARGDRSYVVFVRVDDAAGVGLMRLAGQEPSWLTGWPAGRDRRARRAERRSATSSGTRRRA